MEAFNKQQPPEYINGDAVLHRNINSQPLTVVGAFGSWLCLSAGFNVLDASCGPAVSCLGHSSIKRVEDAMIRAMRIVSYAPSHFTTDVVKELCNFLLESTDWKMARAIIYNGGSEANEAQLKMARQFHIMNNEPLRVNFITRKQSYHGATLGALGLSGHIGRREHFEVLLKGASHVSPYNPYRGRLDKETEAHYVQRLEDELDNEFKRLGPETVIAFVAEPVVGASLGSVPGTPNYFKAMKRVCDKYGALLIFDEIMCGMGRTGTLHAWQQMDVVPDIQTIGKGLAAGFQPAAGMLLSHRVVDTLKKNGGAFAHGHTYQGHPVVSAAALEVQRIIRDENLLSNVITMGALLGNLLNARLQNHPNVGDIRGMGLFWGIEFVKDKVTKESFEAALQVGWNLHIMAIEPPHQIHVYPGAGTNDGVIGDHIQIMPPYNVSKDEIHLIVDRITNVIELFFAKPEFESGLQLKSIL